MRIKLKICGMRDPVNIREVAELQPDFMGFIFYEKSPRCVPPDFALSSLPETIKKVGVFVNEEVDTIMDRVMHNRLDFVQLHGDESVTVCGKLKEKGVPLIKVFSLDDHFDFSTTQAYSKVVDYFLFDTKGKYRGGNSTVFDWSMLKKYNQGVPFFLGGGLSPENIPDSNQFAGMNLFALDVNSGVEDAPALKNIDKIKQLYQRLKK